MHDRLKLDVINQYLYAGQGVTFTDPYFTVEDMTIWENAKFSRGDLADQEAITKYLRAYDFGWSVYNGWSLWGSDGIQLNDMKQGDIGNGHIIAAAATIAQKSAVIEAIFDNEDLNNEGFYQINMFKLGSPIVIQVDDILPISLGGAHIYAQASPDQGLWGPILEKSFADFYGNYEVL